MGAATQPSRANTRPKYVLELNHQVEVMNHLVRGLSNMNASDPACRSFLVTLGDTCERVSERIQYLLRWGDD